MRTPGMDALAEAARRETARVYGTLCREHSAVIRDAALVEQWQAWRTRQPREHRPALTVVPTIETSDRDLIEQGIARGETDQQIAETLGCNTTSVAYTRARMDALSA